MSAPLGRLRLPWVDLPLFGLLLACAPVCALPDLSEQVGLGPGGASLLERAALPQVLSTAVIHILGFRCFFFFAYKYLYTCLAGTPAQPYSHKG